MAQPVTFMATNSSFGHQTPAIINPMYAAEDVVVADYVVTEVPYRADSTGVQDSTAAIQSALYDCYDSGGGTVYLPAGNYLVANTIVKNVKGTVLYRSAVAYNSSDVGTWENITFNNSYWANAGAAYHAPNLATLNNWTRANGIAFTFGDLEWEQFFGLACSDYLYGINIVAGARISFCGEFLWANYL